MRSDADDEGPVAEEGPIKRMQPPGKSGRRNDDKSLTGGVGTAMYVSPELEHAQKGTRYTQVLCASHHWNQRAGPVSSSKAAVCCATRTKEC
jgi:hypothetical protein